MWSWSLFTGNMVETLVGKSKDQLVLLLDIYSCETGQGLEVCKN